MDLTRRNGQLDKNTALKKALLNRKRVTCQSTSARAMKGKTRQVQQSKKENWGEKKRGKRKKREPYGEVQIK